MSEASRAPTGKFVEVRDAHNSGESATDGEENPRSQAPDRRMTSSEIDRRINEIVAPLSTQLKTFIQSVRAHNQRSSTRTFEENVELDRSRSPGQRSESQNIQNTCMLDVCFVDLL